MFCSEGTRALWAEIKACFWLFVAHPRWHNTANLQFLNEVKCAPVKKGNEANKSTSMLHTMTYVRQGVINITVL
jgi:hypothetical protein